MNSKLKDAKMLNLKLLCWLICGFVSLQVTFFTRNSPVYLTGVAIYCVMVLLKHCGSNLHSLLFTETINNERVGFVHKLQH